MKTFCSAALRTLLPYFFALIAAFPLAAQIDAIPLNTTVSGEAWLLGDLGGSTTNLRYLSPLALLGGELYLAGRTSTTGNELYRFNSDSRAVELVVDLVPGATGSNPLALTTIGNILVFHAETTEEGRELYRTDGTEAGTRRIVINPGPDPAFDFSFSPDRNALFGAFGPLVALSVEARGSFFTSNYFALYDSRTDSVIVVDDVDRPNQVLQYNGDFFVMTDFSGLYRVTPEGNATRLNRDAPSGHYRVLGNRLFVSGRGDVAFVDPVSGDLEFAYDYSGSTTLSDTTTFTVGDATYFVNSHNDFGLAEFWRTDGTAAGTVCLNANPEDQSFQYVSFTVLPEGLFAVRRAGFDGRLVSFDPATETFNSLGLPGGVESPSGIVSWDGTIAYRSENASGVYNQYVPGAGAPTALSMRFGTTLNVREPFVAGDYLVAGFFGDADLNAVLYARSCSPVRRSLNLSACPGETVEFDGRQLSAGTQLSELFPVLRACDTLLTVSVAEADTTALQITGPLTIPQGQTASFSSANGVAITWPDGSMGTSFDLETSTLDLGVYSFTASAIDPTTGCESRQGVSITIEISSGLSPLASNTLRLAPNPAQVETKLLDMAAGSTWTLTDISGRRLRSGDQASVDLRGVSAGMYVLHVRSPFGDLTMLRVLVE